MTHTINSNTNLLSADITRTQIYYKHSDEKESKRRDREQERNEERQRVKN